MFTRTLPASDTTHSGAMDGRGPARSSLGLGLSSPSTFTSTLSPSLLSDLKRFGDEPGSTELLPVLAACVRHATPLTLHLHHGASLVRLSVFPREQLFHWGLDPNALSSTELERLHLVHVEPEYDLERYTADHAPASPPRLGALAPLLWLLARHGARSELLPEIAGRVRYRLARGLSLQGLPVEHAALPMLRRLRGMASSLEDLAGATALSENQIGRLLNALYLQSGLMISRSFPVSARAALNFRLGR